jgi:FKBP-type peptidyl-prolyl cis-trans isomerase
VQDIVVGDGHLPEGLEKGLEKIKKGQHAIVTLEPKYAYGDEGSENPPVPKGCKVEFEVTINDVVPTYQLQLVDKLKAAEKRKDQVR